MRCLQNLPGPVISQRAMLILSVIDNHKFSFWQMDQLNIRSLHSIETNINGSM